MAGKLGALRALLEASEKPLSQIRDVGAAFIERSPLSFFENFRHPAEDMVDASKKYGVKFESHGPGKLAVGLPDNSYNYFAEQISPRMFDIASMRLAPSLGRVVRELDPDSIYHIDAGQTGIGSNIGSRLYPAIFDSISGGMGRYNVPTKLTHVNEMRRNLNSTDALLRNPKLSETVLPIDQQLNSIRLTPEDYMTLNRQERVGALALAHAAKSMQRLDEVRKHYPDYINSDQYRSALAAADSLSPMTSRARFSDPVLSQLYKKGIGPSTLKRMNIVDAILSEQKINPDLWTGLGKAKGGLV